MKVRIIPIFLCLVLSALGQPLKSGGEESPCRIVFSNEVEVTGDQIALKDAASEICERGPQWEKIASISLGRSPLPGETRVLDRDYILLKLRQAGIEGADGFLDLPQKISVKRASFEVTSDYLEGLVMPHLYPMLPWDKESVRVKSVRMDRKVLLPKGNIDVQFELPRKRSFGGAISVGIIFRVDGSFEKRASAVIQLEVAGEAVVAKRPVKRNQFITREDVAVVDVNLMDLAYGCIADSNEVIGRRAKRMIGANTPFRNHDIELLESVKKGELVTILAQSASIRIRGLATARQSGRIGDFIKVANLDSGKEISARIVDNGVVAVEF